METQGYNAIVTSCNMCDLMKEDDTIGKVDSVMIENTKDLNDFDSGTASSVGVLHAIACNIMNIASSIILAYIHGFKW